MTIVQTLGSSILLAVPLLAHGMLTVPSKARPWSKTQCGTSGHLRTHGASTAMGSPKRMSTSSLVAAELKRFGLASAFPFKPGLSGGREILAPASRFLMLSVSTPSF